MGNPYLDNQKEGDVFRSSGESVKLTGSSDFYVSDSKSRTLILDLTQSKIGENLFRELLLKRSRALGITVPKHLVSLDERYFRRCLELMHINASKGALAVNLSSLEMAFTPKYGTVARRNSLQGANNALGNDEGAVESFLKSGNMMSLEVGGSSIFEDKRCIPLDYRGSRNQEYGSSSSSYSQGKLHCTWEGGIPCFDFSLDDRKDLYVANAWRGNNKALDYVYSFHSKPSEIKMPDFVDLIGKMKVSTFYSLCTNDSKIMETKSVLVCPNENHASDQNNRKGRKLSKLVGMLKGGHSLKKKTPSLFDGANDIPGDFSSEEGLYFTTNLEMAAIIIKDHIQNEQIENEEVGGWGLKYLKNKHTKISSVSSALSSKCSTSIDIIVPQGHHGGPKNEPWSLIKRWKSGGECDCGGWDVGCPLKVLKAKPRNSSEEDRPCSESPSACKSFDVFSEGSEHGRPTLRLVNVHEGLYSINFKSSSFSPLQCFSIAVAIIHSQSPSLRPKHVH